jgi:hypothetical protein
MLNEQHIPRSVGNFVKILEQGRGKPFQEQVLSIPEMIPLNMRSCMGLVDVMLLTKFVPFLTCYPLDVKARHLRVPEQFKESRIALLNVHMGIGLLSLCSNSSLE